MITIRVETTISIEIEVDDKAWLLQQRGGEWVIDPALQDGRYWIAQARIHWCDALKRALGMLLGKDY